MKIAHLVSTFPPHVGGMGQVCLDEAGLLAGEHQVTVFTLAYPGREYNAGNFPFSVRRLRPVFQMGDGGWLSRLTIELAGYDLVHLHYPFYGAAGAVIAAKKRLGWPLVITYHMDAQTAGVKRWLVNIYDYFYARRLFDVADKVIGVDADYFRQAKYGRFIGKEKSVILPNGIDTEFFSPGPADYSGATLAGLAGKKIILFVGNLLPVKNLDILIKALPGLDSEAVLLVAGGGYDEARYRALVKNAGLENRVRFAGRMEQKDLLNCYRVAAAVAVPSFSESFSLVVLAAMSAGAPVTASDIPGIRGRIDNTFDGFLLPVNDLAAWTSGLTNILNLSPEERRTIGERARNKSLNYSLEKHVGRLEEIYSSI